MAKLGECEIGLRMAGAISVGAYTVGVMGFFLEALEAWHDAKARASTGRLSVATAFVL